MKSGILTALLELRRQCLLIKKTCSLFQAQSIFSPVETAIVQPYEITQPASKYHSLSGKLKLDLSGRLMQRCCFFPLYITPRMLL